MSVPKIEVHAAQMAIDWEYRFAMELKQAAVEMANGLAVITQEHYRAALPLVLNRFTKVINPPTCESSNGQSRAA